MQKLVWQNANGDSIDLTSGNYGITQWEGFSNTSLNIQSQQVPFQDGAVFLDALLNQRELSVTLKMQDNGNLEERYRMRRELIHKLNPKLGEGYLIYTNDFISKRIKCLPQVPLFPTHNSNDSGTPKASLSWTACEPYWEDLKETIINLKEDGEVTLIENNGDVPTHLKIEIGTMLVTDIDIINVDTQKRIKINGNLEKFTEINTNVGQKKVVAKNDLYKRMGGGAFYNIATNGEILVYAGSFVMIEDLFGNITSVNKSLDDIVYANNRFQAIKDDKLYSSKNGITWTEITLANFYASHIYYLNGEFLICGNRQGSGVIYYSQTGSVWLSVVVCNDLYDYSSICFNGTNCIAVFSDGVTSKVYSSANGISWTLVSTVNMALENIIYADGYYYAISLRTLQRSSDLVNWTEAFTNQYSLYSIGYFNGLFILVGSYIYTSKNGTFWETGSAECPFRVTKVTYINGQYYILSRKGIIIKSDDGKRWSNFIPELQYDNTGIGWKDGVYLASDGYGIFKSSDGGNHWEEIESVFGKKIITVDEKVIVYGIGNTFYESEDLVNWTSKTVNGLTDIQAMFCGNGKYIAGSSKYEVGVSTDGDTWTTAEISGVFVSFAYANNIYIGIKNDGYIYSSSDGLNWTLRNSDSTFKSVAVSSSNLFVAVGDLIKTSTNGTSWTTRFTPTSTLNCVKYQEDVFLAVGENSLVVKSINGTSWVKQDSEGLLSLTDIATDNWSCIAVGAEGALLITEKKEAENLISRLSTDSDMNLMLKLGNNHFKILTTSGNYSARLHYTQKYLGV